MFTFSFELNNKPMSAFKILGFSYPAFSGFKPHINKRISACIPDFGPIPPGTYFILDRQSGGFLSAIRNRFGTREDWFSLYANDGRIDDKTYCNYVERGNFRLHPSIGIGVSKGCITVESQANFNQLRQLLKSIKPEQVPNSDILAYGKVLVK